MRYAKENGFPKLSKKYQFILFQNSVKMELAEFWKTYPIYSEVLWHWFSVYVCFKFPLDITHSQKEWFVYLVLLWSKTFFAIFSTILICKILSFGITGVNYSPVWWPNSSWYLVLQLNKEKTTKMQEMLPFLEWKIMPYSKETDSGFYDACLRGCVPWPGLQR